MLHLDYLHDHPGPWGEYVLHHAPLFLHNAFMAVHEIRIHQLVVLLNDVVDRDQDPLHVLSFRGIGWEEVVLCLELKQLAVIENGHCSLVGGKKFGNYCQPKQHRCRCVYFCVVHVVLDVSGAQLILEIWIWAAYCPTREKSTSGVPILPSSKYLGSASMNLPAAAAWSNSEPCVQS